MKHSKKVFRTILISLLFSFAVLGCTNTVVQEVTPSALVDSATEKKPAATASIIFETTLEHTIPVIFSHDGAPDDIATLVYIANHPNIDLLGVVQSYGEQHPSESIEEWQIFLYDVLDRDDVALGLGAEDPMDPAYNEFPASWRSGADNFWGLQLPSASQSASYEEGADMLIRLVKESSEKVSILVTGAQTDMALALRKDPSIADNISQIVIMGGAFNRDGNLHEFPGYEHNHVAEWNIYVDPLAAKEVFLSGIPLSIVSLDGSDDFVITRDDHARISESSEPEIQLLSDLWEQNFRIWNGNFKIWDIVAAVALTNPEYFSWTYDGVDVVVEQGNTHGQTIRLDNACKYTRFTAITSYIKVRETVFAILDR